MNRYGEEELEIWYVAAMQLEVERAERIAQQMTIAQAITMPMLAL